MSKKIILGILIVIAICACFYIYWFLLKEQEPVFSLAEVERGNISQEILAVGTIIPDKKIILQFNTQGKIKEILVETGDKVEEGQNLIELDSSDLYIQKQQAEASLELAHAKLKQLLAGESAEQIEIYKTKVKNAEKSLEDAEIALQNAKQNLKDVEMSCETNLTQAYEDAINVLENIDLKVYNTFRIIDLIQRRYFTDSNQESIIIKNNRNKIEQEMIQIKSCVGKIKNDSRNKNIDTCLLQTNSSLNQINNSLIIIRDTIEKPTYRDIVSSADKTSLDTQRTNVLSSINDITEARQTIAYLKISNQTNINTALTNVDTFQNKVNIAQGALCSARDEKALIEAEPRETDIALYQAQIKQGEANLSLIQKQIKDMILKAPIAGTIAQINQEIGETVNKGNPVIVMFTKNRYQIEADISESDIGKIALAQTAKINLDAFPDQEFFGKVIEIEPAETILAGVVYYRIKLGINNEKNFDIKPGMTANLVILSDKRENVLIIPLRAVKERDNKKIVRIPIDSKNFQEITIETGLIGNNGIIEVVSGLKQGDKVITFIRSFAK